MVLGGGMDAPVSCYMSKQTNLVTEFLPTQHVQTQLDIVARGPGIGGSARAPAAPPVNQGLPSYGIWWKSVGKQKF
jgi:hypothetical protein